jgi:hypothetical protein
MEQLYLLFTLYFYSLLLREYMTISNPGGPIYLRRDLEEMKNVSRIIRAFTFAGKESAYYYNRYGTKMYVRY